MKVREIHNKYNIRARSHDGAIISTYMDDELVYSEINKLSALILIKGKNKYFPFVINKFADRYSSMRITLDSFLTLVSEQCPDIIIKEGVIEDVKAYIQKVQDREMLRRL